MTEKRLKDQIKDVKKILREKRRQFSKTALASSITDLKLIEKLQREIGEYSRKLVDLENKYKKIDEVDARE